MIMIILQINFGATDKLSLWQSNWQRIATIKLYYTSINCFLGRPLSRIKDNQIMWWFNARIFVDFMSALNNYLLFFNNS